MYGTLHSFLCTFGNEKPKDAEFDFVLSVAGTISNVASVAPGRQFLVTNENGKNILTLMLDAITDGIESPHLSKLERYTE